MTTATRRFAAILIAAAVLILIASPTGATALLSNRATLSPALPTRADLILRAWHDPNDPTVLVVAHRGAWRQVPENSIAAIEAAIRLGVDMVELDVRKTSDGGLVLMHDTTLNRTTTASGRVDSFTLDEVTRLRLRDHTDRLTNHRVPTLAEALEAYRGRVLFNLDKTNGFEAECLAIAASLDMTDHIVIKARVAPDAIDDYKRKHGLSDTDGSIESASFMPIVRFDAEAPDRATETMRRYRAASAPAVEVCFKERPSGDRLAPVIGAAHDGAYRLWINTLWDSISGGRSDELAMTDPDAVWGWYVDRGYSVIQTDRPAELLAYLRSRGRHW